MSQAAQIDFDPTNDRIDPEIVHRVVTEDRADLAELLRLLLDAADR